MFSLSLLVSQLSTCKALSAQSLSICRSNGVWSMHVFQCQVSVGLRYTAAPDRETRIHGNECDARDQHCAFCWIIVDFLLIQSCLSTSRSLRSYWIHLSRFPSSWEFSDCFPNKSLFHNTISAHQSA